MAAVHMTEGNIAKHLIAYSIPLILGNLFQLTYNAVDSIIVGHFIGKRRRFQRSSALLMFIGKSSCCRSAAGI